MKGDNAEEFLRRNEPGLEIRTTKTFSDALHQLSTGTFDAVVIQRLVVSPPLSGNRPLKPPCCKQAD